jgi:hypothetical protein
MAEAHRPAWCALHFVSTGVSIGNTAPAGTSAAIEATVSNVRGSPP